MSVVSLADIPPKEIAKEVSAEATPYARRAFNDILADMKASALRESRHRVGLSQQRLAARAGTSQAAISDYESGKRIPSTDSTRRLERALRPLPSAALEANRQRVLEASSAAGVANVRVFGSVVQGADRPDSDIDLLVTLPDGMGGVAFTAFCFELEAVLGTPVDVISDAAVPADSPIRDAALHL